MVKVPRYKEQINGQTWPKSSVTFVSRHKETFISQVRHRPRDTLAVIHHFILASLSLSLSIPWCFGWDTIDVTLLNGLQELLLLFSLIFFLFALCHPRTHLFVTLAAIYIVWKRQMDRQRDFFSSSSSTGDWNSGDLEKNNGQEPKLYFRFTWPHTYCRVMTSCDLINYNKDHCQFFCLIIRHSTSFLVPSFLKSHCM